MANLLVVLVLIVFILFFISYLILSLNKLKNELYNKQPNAIVEWIVYDWNDKLSRPPAPGRYLIYRKKCNKMHFEMWNGNGWAYSNNDCSHWCEVFPPCTYEK